MSPGEYCMQLRAPAYAALAILTWFSAAAGAAAPSPTVTFVEGPSTIISGKLGFVPAAGVPLRQCDIVRTGPKALVQAESDDGGQIVVGHDSRMLFELPGSGEGAVGPVFLLSGWAKVAVPKRDKVLPYRVATPYFDLSISAGAAVVHVDSDGGTVFLEEGNGIVTAPSGTSESGIKIAAWHSYGHKAGQPAGAVAKGIDPAFLKGMPRSMRDNPPSILTRLKARDVQPQAAPGYDPGEAEQWLKSIVRLRPCVADSTVSRGQEALRRQGLEVGAIDGVLGPRTQAALRVFQQRSGLTVTGRFDAETLRALEVLDRR